MFDFASSVDIFKCANTYSYIPIHSSTKHIRKYHWSRKTYRVVVRRISSKCQSLRLFENEISKGSVKIRQRCHGSAELFGFGHCIGDSFRPILGSVENIEPRLGRTAESEGSVHHYLTVSF